jgi:DNA-binding transcriptional LysR family regulator
VALPDVTEPDWFLWRSFLAVIEAGSLSAAARRLGASQPTVGRHVEELERHLGSTLFERTGRGLHPTAMALRLVEPVRQAQDALGAARVLAAGAAEDLAGTVRITASNAVSHAVLPTRLHWIRERYPEIELELVSTDAADNLLLREADIAIRMFRPGQLDVVTRKLGEIELIGCAHEDYLKRRGTPRSIAELAGHDLIGLDRQDDILRVARSLGFELQRHDFALRTDSHSQIWELTKAGLGISFNQKPLIATTPAMVPLLPEIEIPPMQVWLTTHRELAHSRRIRVVYDLLAEIITAYIEIRQPRLPPRRAATNADASV